MESVEAYFADEGYRSFESWGRRTIPLIWAVNIEVKETRQVREQRG